MKSYSEDRLIATAKNNLDCLLAMLRFNVEHDVLFFRVTSDLVPFASHPVCRFDWLSYFKDDFIKIGSYISANNIRISMHPGQFTVINSQRRMVLENSVRDLVYHSQILDALGLDASAKIQLHVGGVYGDTERSIARFIERYRNLDERTKRRLVIENDDRSYTLRDCMRIHGELEVPILFDVLHHQLNSSGERIPDAFRLIAGTWKPEDGIPMVDYGYSQRGGAKVSHAESIDPVHFEQFLAQTRPFDFDVMLEIKDKETSALKAVQLAKKDERFFTKRSKS